MMRKTGLTCNFAVADPAHGLTGVFGRLADPKQLLDGILGLAGRHCNDDGSTVRQDCQVVLITPRLIE